MNVDRIPTRSGQPIVPAYPWEDPDFARHIGEDSIRFKKRHLKEYDTRTEVRDFHGIAEYGKTSLKLGALSKGFQQITERHGIKDAEVPPIKGIRAKRRGLSEGGDSDNDSDGYDSDWDTSAWSPDEIHSSLELLIDTAQSAHQKKKRRVAIAMMVRLLKKHKSARERMDVLLFGLVELGLSMRKGKAHALSGR